MKEFILEKPNSLSCDTCDKIVNIFEKFKDKHYKGLAGKNLNLNKSVKNTIDLNIFEILDYDEESIKIKNILMNEISNNLNGYLNYVDPTLTLANIYKHELSYDTFLIHKYIKNTGRFTYHNDFSILIKDNKYRVLNFMWYLNDVSIGGETEFFGYYKIKPEIGKMIMFPSDWFFPHCGKVPISNDKYVLTGWIYINI
jgi:hypothetical protein